MTPQEAITGLRRQLNELRNQHNKVQRDLKLKDEQIELRRQMNGHIDCHCIDCIDPLPPPPPDPWPVDPLPRQAQQTHCPVDYPLQQTHLPLDLPARESSIANIRSLDSFYQTDNDQFNLLPSSNIKHAPSAISITCIDPLPPLTRSLASGSSFPASPANSLSSRSPTPANPFAS